jgi:acetyl-CoA carboxylase carboxyl transferase subunit alpha
MPKPEGYRKSIRIMEMADRFGLPIITLVDTAGAYPGINAEERGQAEAIARSIEMCLNVKVPLISIVIGEGGSGGAMAIAAGNQIYMLEHSIYSVASPEAAASILWRDSTRAKEAATSMKITAEDLKSLGLIDGIIPEPLGGAHRDPDSVIAATGNVIASALAELSARSGEQLRNDRRQKFLSMGRNL